MPEAAGNPPATSALAGKRQIKSFVLRQGRLTKGQQRALDMLWPEFGIEPGDTVLDTPSLFGRDAPITLEIGFGNGHSLADMALAAPERDFIGIEVHRPGVGQLLQRIEQDQLTNIRLFCTDAIDVLQQMIPPASIDRVQLFFPDPWPKRKHHKRRILSSEFLTLIATRLQRGGLFHMATDWEHYAHSALKILEQHPDFCNTAATEFCPRPDWRPLTKFEQRGHRLEHDVWDLIFQLTG